MKKLLCFLGLLTGLIVLAGTGLILWRHLTRPFDARLVGAWQSDREKTLAYWQAHYPWAKDSRLVAARSKGLGQMKLAITGREVRFQNHPCYGDTTVRYRITDQSETRDVLSLDNFLASTEWAKFEFADGGMWSVAQVGRDEIREYFQRVDDSASVRNPDRAR